MQRSLREALHTVRALAPPAGFAQRTDELGIALEARAVEALGLHLAMLLEANRAFNLTGIDDPTEAWHRLVLDSLSLLPSMGDLAAGSRLLDVGTGGGFPGLVLAVARPDLRVSLLEATGKKVAFLRTCVERLGLASSVCVLHGRAEQLRRGPLGGSFDVVVARALAALPRALEWTVPFAKPGGLVLLVKGARADEELRAARQRLQRSGAGHERTLATPTGRIVVLRRTHAAMASRSLPSASQSNSVSDSGSVSDSDSDSGS
ncbi:MAG: 16S rRNA (guanine(527)-N(7))-methyltransferase RsmG, partial [Myxococcota bacterium]|nr:16S rRNA (guanine(527)-N(7))-methyltransferase RsmG [Myxococcota bacterium]